MIPYASRNGRTPGFSSDRLLDQREQLAVPTGEGAQHEELPGVHGERVRNTDLQTEVERLRGERLGVGRGVRPSSCRTSRRTGRSSGGRAPRCPAHPPGAGSRVWAAIAGSPDSIADLARREVDAGTAAAGRPTPRPPTSALATTSFRRRSLPGAQSAANAEGATPATMVGSPLSSAIPQRLMGERHPSLHLGGERQALGQEREQAGVGGGVGRVGDLQGRLGDLRLLPRPHCPPGGSPGRSPGRPG